MSTFCAWLQKKKRLFIVHNKFAFSPGLRRQIYRLYIKDGCSQHIYFSFVLIPLSERFACWQLAVCSTLQNQLGNNFIATLQIIIQSASL